MAKKTASELYEMLCREELTGARATDRSVRLAARIARQTSLNDFVCFYENGEIPPTKLSTEEMQLLTGGKFWDDVLNAIDTGVTYVADTVKAIRAKL